MKKFFSHAKHDQQPSDEPPSYEQLEGYQNQSEETPQYSGNYGPNEYPSEKKSEHWPEGGYGPQQLQQPNWQGNNPNNFYNDNNYSNNNNNNNSNNNPGGYGLAQPPPGTYTVPPQKVNIAYETDGRNTRPGYAEYVQMDNQRVAQGDLPLPRDAFGRKGAPLAPSKKGMGLSGAFPGAKGSTYYNSSRDQ